MSIVSRNAYQFSLGRVVSTPGALEAIKESGQDCAEFLNRHASGDWGNVGKDDQQSNDEALRDGDRLLSTYKTNQGVKLWVITEWDRSATTILLPSEY